MAHVWVVCFVDNYPNGESRLLTLSPKSEPAQHKGPSPKDGPHFMVIPWHPLPCCCWGWIGSLCHCPTPAHSISWEALLSVVAEGPPGRWAVDEPHWRPIKTSALPINGFRGQQHFKVYIVSPSLFVCYIPWLRWQFYFLWEAGSFQFNCYIITG